MKGVYFLIAAMSLSPVADGLAKEMSYSAEPFAITFARYFSAGIIALVAARMFGKPIEMPRDHWPTHFLQTGLIMGAMACLITAIGMVPLSQAVGGFLIAPVVAGVLSILIFHEGFRPARVIGALLSFFGALVILRPDGAVEIGTLIALAGGLLLGIYLTLTRVTASIPGGAISALVVQCLLGSAMLLPFALWQGTGSMGTELIPYAIGLGAVSASAHFLTVAAYHHTDASTLAPFFYFSMLSTAIIGVIWFGEIPSREVAIGLTVIALGGVISTYHRKDVPQIFSGLIGYPQKFLRRFMTNG